MKNNDSRIGKTVWYLYFTINIWRRKKFFLKDMNLVFKAPLPSIAYFKTINLIMSFLLNILLWLPISYCLEEKSLACFTRSSGSDPYLPFQLRLISLSLSNYSHSECLNSSKLFMLSGSLGAPGSRLRQGLVFRMFIRECSWDQHPWKGGGRSRIGKKAKSGCDASLTASANRAGSYETEMAHQSRPARTGRTWPWARGLSAVEVVPEVVVSTARAWGIKSFLKGGSGRGICMSTSPYYSWSSSPPVHLDNFCSSLGSQGNSYFFREGFPNSQTWLASVKLPVFL